MEITIGQAHRINLALRAIARGFANGDGKFLPVIKTTSGRLRVSRNLRRLRDVLESADDELAKEREFLWKAEIEENTKVGTELTGVRAVRMVQRVREVNSDRVSVDFETLQDGELDLDHFLGSEGIEALTELEGVIFNSAP